MKLFDRFLGYLADRWLGLIVATALLFSALKVVDTAVVLYRLDYWLGKTTENQAHIKALYDKAARNAERIRGLK